MQLHIGYLRSLEDSERVRVACLNYLQRSLIHFYREDFDIVNQAEQTAKELGGRIENPLLVLEVLPVRRHFWLVGGEAYRNSAAENQVVFAKTLGQGDVPRRKPKTYRAIWRLVRVGIDASSPKSLVRGS